MNESPIESMLLDEEDVGDVSTIEWCDESERGSFMRLLGRVVCRKRFWLAVGLIVVALLAVWAQRAGYVSPAEAIHFLRLHPVIAPALFIALYAIFAVFLLPTLQFNLAAGMLWGWFAGASLALVGVMLGASLAFLIARYLGRDFVVNHLHGKHWQLLWRAIESNGWKTVAFARINPIFPSAPLNYFFGLTGIGFWPYFFSTLLFILPPSLLFAVIGDSIGGFVLQGGAKDLVEKVLVASAAVTVLVVTRLVFKHYSKKSSPQ